MSRVTRSQQAVADENAAPSGGFLRALARRGPAIGGPPRPPAPPPPPASSSAALVNKPPTNISRKTTSGRPALGDISNQIQKPTVEQLPKKKRIEEVAERQYVEVLDDDVPEQLQENHPMVPAKNDDDIDMQQQEEDHLEDNFTEMKLAEIDAADANNPQCVPEYINEIMAYFFEAEPKRMASPAYMQRQTDINTKMREILIDWLVEVHLKFKLRPETLYLTVNLIDRFLEKRSVSRTKLQLVGCTAMLMAAKYEEIYAPEVRDFVYISDSAYTKEQILSMESIMLNTLGFYLTVPTTLRFGERLCRVGQVPPKTETCIRYLMELTLQDARFLKYRPSEIAAASTFLGLKMTNEQWDATIEHHAGYDRARLSDVLADLHELATRDPPKYKAVRKKYQQSKFFEVSKLPVCAL